MGRHIKRFEIYFTQECIWILEASKPLDLVHNMRIINGNMMP